MSELSASYPIEWGLLFSPKRQGEGRYPSLEFVEKLTSSRKLRFAAHLCGGHARRVIEFGTSSFDASIRAYFDRVQINTADPEVNPQEIREWATKLNVDAILQSRRNFPADTSVSWLFDKSGGRGIVPSDWPAPVSNSLAGYAGGLRPENVTDAVRAIGSMSSNYWIDMETGVRDEHDRFDIERCRKVCEVVYGYSINPLRTHNST